MSGLPSGLSGTVTVHESAEALAHAAAEWVLRTCAQASRSAGSFSIALTGGGIASTLYATLAGDPWRDEMDWDAWRAYWGDERAVSPESEDSNYHLVCDALLDHVPVSREHVHRMPADREDLDTAAAEYATLLERTLSLGTADAPRFDCILLGLGENGHCASLFPGTPALAVTDRWVVPGRADYPPYDRMTVTFPTLNAAAHVAFVVAGDSKRDALRATAAGSTPAARVRPVDGSLTWFIDRAAAGSVDAR